MAIKINTESKDQFLEDLRLQVIRFLKTEKARLKIERAFLSSVKDKLKQADRKYRQITEVDVYADVADLLGIEAPEATTSSDAQTTVVA